MRAILPPWAAVFLAGAATMAFELLVPRRLAPWLGTALPVWTATFAVVLLGLATGSALGGWFADRLPRRTAEPAVLLLAALGVALAPFVGPFVAARAHPAGPVLAATAAAGAMAFLPLLCLGAVYPLAARQAVLRAPRPGTALGRLAAAGALGSVAGTFAAAYLVIPHVDVPTAHLVVAAVLAGTAVLRRGPPEALAPTAAPLPSRADLRAAPRTAVPSPAPAPALAVLLLVAALGGAATLVLEVVAARRAALDAGSSLETWTSVLGVVLAGLAVGGALGGRLAAAREARGVLVGVLAVAALLVAATPWTASALPSSLSGSAAGFRVRVAQGIALGYGAAFTAIGALTPVLARAALAGASTTGRRVGAVSAVGTLGALLGSLATGPLLLPRLRLEGAAFALAAALALAAAAVARRRALPVALALGCAGLAVVAAAPWARAREVGLALALRPDADGVWVRDGGYARVLVDRAPEGAHYGRDVRRMKIDLRTHGIHDLGDPGWIGSNYGTLYAAATERIAHAKDAPRVLFLGGGTYTAPRWIFTWRPRAVVDVAEIDPDVTRGARDMLGLADRPGLRIVHDDARAVVRDAAAGAGARYDLVYMDAFGDLGVPWHLTTREFVRDVRRAMAPDGVYFANSIDVFAEGRFVAGIWATLKEAFRQVEVIGVRRGDSWVQNFVFVASDAPFDLEGLERRDPAAWDEGGRLEVVRYAAAEFDDLAARRGARPLEDDFAPVEDMLSPAVEITSRR